MELEKLKLHFTYIVIILVSILIIIATGMWTDKDNFTEFLANAATMISIVLGLVAIFYSFISNTSLSQSLGNIGKVSDEVTLAHGQMGKFLEHASDLERLSEENTRTLRDISASVEEKVTSLRSVLEEVSIKTDSLHQNVGKNFERLESYMMESGSDNHVSTASVPDSQSQKVIRSEQASSFWKKSSQVGRLLLYACTLAESTKKPLSLQSLSEKLDLNRDYLHG